MGREERARDENSTEGTPALTIAPMTLTLDQITQMMTAAVAAGVKASTMGSADLHAEAMKKALKPENTMSPMISVFNPEGDRDHPRPALKCAFTLFDGIPVDGTTDTVEEITLYNQLEHGEYRVSRSDGSSMPFRVKEIRNDMGQLQRIDIWFPYRDAADVAAVMPMRVWLADVVAQIAERKAQALAAA